jgi:TPR repeat protein
MLLISGLVVQGCVTLTGIEKTDLSEVKPGTNRQAVEAVLGEPVETTETDFGLAAAYKYNSKELKSVLSDEYVAYFALMPYLWPFVEQDAREYKKEQEAFLTIIYDEQNRITTIFSDDQVETLLKAKKGDSAAHYILASKTKQPDQQWRWLCRAAHSGDGRARYYVADYYRYGYGDFSVDQAQAYKWLSLAEESGVGPKHKASFAGFLSPDQIAKGEHLVEKWEPNPSECELEAKAVQTNQADKGSTVALFPRERGLVGSRPSFRIVDRNSGEKVTNTVWLEQRAKEVDAEATYYLAYSTLNKKVRIKLICISAHGGYGEAQHELGRFYDLGMQPVQRDQVEGYKWLSLAAARIEKSARLKDALAKTMTPEQVAEAKRRAAEWQPNPTECELEPMQEAFWSPDELAEFNWVTKEELREIRAQQCELPLTEAIKLDAETQLHLATDCIGLGLGAPVIWRWRCLSAHQGDHAAQNHVGHYFRVGSTNVQQDLVEAYKWYGLAIGNGNERATELRHSISGQMTPDQIAEAEHLITEWEPNPAECEVKADD